MISRRRLLSLLLLSLALSSGFSPSPPCQRTWSHSPNPLRATPSTSGTYNVVLTHCTADFDSLASAVGLAKLWSTARTGLVDVDAADPDDDDENPNHVQAAHYSTPRAFNPTYVVLPRGAHPGVAKFLSLHKHLFPIKNLRDLPNPENLDRLGLVDAQRRERVGEIF